MPNEVKLLPCEPTPEMIAAGKSAVSGWPRDSALAAIWKAMFDAARPTTVVIDEVVERVDYVVKMARQYEAAVIRVPEAVHGAGERLEQAKRELNAALASMPTVVTGERQGWQPIESAPEFPMAVLLYVPAEVIEGVEAGQDYRIQIGFWNGKTFCEQGTGHDYRERVEDCQPTLWQPLPEPPEVDTGDHALPCSASSPVSRSRPKAAAAIARGTA